MVDVVDAITADLRLTYGGYAAGVDKVLELNRRLHKSIASVQDLGLNAPPGYAKNGVADVALAGAVAHEKAAERIKRARKSKTDDAVQGDRAETASAKTAAKEQADAQISEAARSARFSAAAQRAVDRAGSQVNPARNSSLGRTVPRERTGQRSIPNEAISAAGAQEAAAESEINHRLADQATLRSKLSALSGAELRNARDLVSEMTLIGQLERAGLDEAAIALRLEERRAFIEKERAGQEKRQASMGLSQFARGAGVAGIGAGGGAAIAGVTLAATIGVAASTIQSAADYAKELKNVSDQIGLTTQQTQVYEAEARRLGVSQDELRNGLGQFADYLGRAKQGGEDQVKTFEALGISVKDFANAGDALPTVIARISSIPDAARRAAVETRLFGEEGRKLDGLLSGGNDRINELAEAMLKAGTILSAADIARLASVSKELDRVKAQLQVSYASIVADNADAIITLANSFGKLVNDIREAIRWIQAFNSQKLNDLTPEGRQGQTLAPKLIADSQTAYENLFRRGTTFFGSQLAPQTPQRDMVNGETRAFLERIKGASVQDGAVDTGLLNKLNAPKALKGPKQSNGKSAGTVANEADQRTRQFNDQLSRYQDERLAALADQNSDENDRRQAQRDQIDRESAIAAADIKLRAQEDIRKGAEAGLTNARRDQLVAAERAASDEKIQVINLGDTLSTLQRRAAAEVDVLNFADDILRAQRDLATTTEQRRDIDKKLLDNAQKREAVGANTVLRRAEEGDPSITRQDVESANRTLANQPALKAVAAKQIDRANESPLDTYRRELKEATKDTTAAFESIEVNGLNRLEDQLTGTISKVLGLHGAFGELFGGILADIARLELKKGILSFLESGNPGSGGGGFLGKLFSLGRSAGGGSGGFSSSDFLNSGGGPLAGGYSVPGFAGGGSMTIGGNPGIDRNTLSLNGNPIARVGHGEVLSVSPNAIRPNNSPVARATPQVTVLAPRQYDLRNSLIDRDTLAQMNAENRDFALQVSRAHAEEAVKASGSQVPGILQKKSQLG